MALHGNYSVLNKTPGRWLGGTSAAHVAGVGAAHPQTPANWNRGGATRNIAMQEGATNTLELLAIPTGYNANAWVMPLQAGALSSFDNTRGVASFAGAMAAGRNLSGTFAGAGAWTGVGQLVVSGSGTFSGAATFSGNIVAALAASGTFAGAATVSGTAVARGFMSGTFSGAATFTAVRYATGSMAGSFAPPIELDAANFSAYLLDREDIETGMTLRQALRLVAAATAGKISGASSTTVTIRNAVADSRNRITATVDGDGNRSAIIYDLTG